MKPCILMRSIGLAFLVSVVLLLHASQRQLEANDQTSLPSAMIRAKGALERFVQKPSSLTGSKFYISISRGKETDSVKTGILDHIFVRGGQSISIGPYRTIAIEMLQGNIYAAKAAIILLDFVDNGWQRPRSETIRVAGWIGESLGDLVRVNPVLFLRACYEERENPYLKEKGYPIGFIPDFMKRKTTRVAYELEMRKKALWSVEDLELRPARDECIEAIDREIIVTGSNIPGFGELERRPSEDPRTEIISVFTEMQSRPNPENMKRVLSLFSEVPREYFVDLLDAMFPEAGRRDADIPLEIICREARCCNEYAIEVLFRALVHWLGLQSDFILEDISNLILIRPGLFIEKLAKYRQLLDDVDSISKLDQHYFEWICDYISIRDYWDVCMDVILRRRIDTLAALNMPQHRELIGRCIRVIENRLGKIKSVRSTVNSISQDENKGR